MIRKEQQHKQITQTNANRSSCYVYKPTKMVDRVGTKQVATTNANNKENKNNNDQDIVPVPRRGDVGTEKRANSSSSSSNKGSSSSSFNNNNNNNEKDDGDGKYDDLWL